MKEILPQRVHSRTDKMGCVAQDDIWMKTNPEQMRELLLEATKRISSLVRPEIILNYYDRYTAGQSGCHPILFRVIALSAWMKAFELKSL